MARLSDTLLVYALAVLAGTNLVATFPSAIAGEAAAELETWGPLWTRLIGSIAFATAAFVPAGRLVRITGVATRVVGWATATVALGVLTGVLLAPFLPA